MTGPPNHRARRKAERAARLPAVTEQDATTPSQPPPRPISSIRLSPMVLDLLITLFFAAGLLFAWRSHHFMLASVQAPGVVSELVEKHGVKGGRVYQVVAQFQDAQGNTRTYRANMSASPPIHAVGDRVVVIYDPRDPDHNGLLTFTDRFAVAWVLIGMALFGAFLRVGFVWGDHWVSWAYPLP